MKIDFDCLHWHDAELVQVDIPRFASDVVKLTVCWPNSGDGEAEIIEFYDCYGFYANMNFGVLPPDTIINANIVDDSERLDKIKGRQGER